MQSGTVEGGNTLESAFPVDAQINRPTIYVKLIARRLQIMNSNSITTISAECEDCIWRRTGPRLQTERLAITHNKSANHIVHLYEGLYKYHTLLVEVKENGDTIPF